jgi:hypothetical protein
LALAFPAFLDPALFAGLEADSLLACVTTSRSLLLDDIVALFGILPLGSGHQELARSPPRDPEVATLAPARATTLDPEIDR